MADINDIRGMSEQAGGQSKKLEKARNNGEITPDDYNAIDSCSDHYVGRDWNSAGTKRDRLSQLRLSATRSDTPLTDFASIDDVNTLLDTHADAGAASANAQRGYSAALRAFFAFLDEHDDWGSFPFHDSITPKTGLKADTDDEPDSVTDDEGKIKPDEVLDWSDVLSLQRHASDPRDKTFITFLADTGLRVAAACQLRIGDIHAIDSERPWFTPNRNATGQKGLNSSDIDKFPIHDSISYLRPWLNTQHPEAPDPHPDAPLFPIRRGYDSKPRAECAAAPRTLHDQIDKAADAAEIEKPVNPHAFRHACVKRLKLEYDYDWPELRDALGWSDDSVSEMAQRYGRLDTDERYDRLWEKRGVEIDGDDDGDGVDPKQNCRNCGTIADAAAEFCPQCGATLDEDKADRQTPSPDEALEERVEELESTLVEIMDRAETDPRTLDEFADTDE